MSVVPENISVHIERSIKVGEYKYNKVDLGIVVSIKDEQPGDIINKLYNYLDPHVDRLLEAELAKVDSNKQAVADMISEEQNDDIFNFK